MNKHNSVKLLAVNFVVFNLLKFGKNKGQPDPRSLHHVTLMRDPSCETVGDTIERLKDMYSVYTIEQHGKKAVKVYTERMQQRFRIVSAKETDDERIARYERMGLEVQADGIADPVKVVDVGGEPLLVKANDPEIEIALEALGL